MKKFLRVFAIALIGIIALGLAACEGGGGDNDRITVSPTSLTFEAEGSTKEVTISGEGWTTSTNASWIQISEITGGISVTVGSTTEARNDSITVSHTSGDRMIYVSQNAPGGDEITVSPLSLSFTAEGSSETVTVTGQGAWTATASDPWIGVAPASGNGNGTFTVTVGANDGDARNGSITVGGTTIPVSQAGAAVEDREVFTVSDALISRMTNPAMIRLSLNQAGFSDSYYIYMDMYSPQPSVPEVPEGVYTVAEGTTQEYILSLNPNRTYVAYYDANGGSTPSQIMSGTVTVGRDGANHVFTIDVTLANGTEFKGLYNGILNVSASYGF